MQRTHNSYYFGSSPEGGTILEIIMRKYKIDITSQRYSGYTLIVDVRDADTNEFLFTTRKELAEEIVATMNSARSSVG